MNTSTETLKQPAPKLRATGRRKTAIAQVRLVPTQEGAKISINRQSPELYFRGNSRQTALALQSYQLTPNASAYNVFVTVRGGGISGQAEAIRHGIARAFSQLDDKIKLQMRKEGFLTRDPRAVERKKSGQPKARKRFQYSKR